MASVAVYPHQSYDSSLTLPDQHFAETQEELIEARKEAKRGFMAQQISDITAGLYQIEILEHMLEMEIQTAPDVNSIDIQTEIRWNMRPYLFDFLVETHAVFRLLPETLFLMVNIIDRYCSKRVVYKRHYQLVGCAALLIAAKYGDRKDRVPTISELRALCCSSYDDDMFQQMERHVFQTLDWNIGHPTVDAFLKMAMGPNHDPVVEHLALYICEVAFYHREFVSTPPSMMAKTSLALARSILDRPQAYSNEWASGYSQSLGSRLCSYLYDVPSVIHRKYMSSSLSEASLIMTAFIRQQIALSNRSAALQSEMALSKKPSVHVTKPSVTSTDPQTPHGHPYDQTAIVVNGCLTPPITPDPTQLTHANPSTYEYHKGPQSHYYTPSPSPVASLPGQVHPSMQQQQQQLHCGQQPTPISNSYASSYHRVPSHTHLHPQSSYSSLGSSS